MSVPAADDDVDRNDFRSPTSRDAVPIVLRTRNHATIAAPTGMRLITPPITHQPTLLSNTHAPVANVASPTRPATTMTLITSDESLPMVDPMPVEALVAMRSMSVTGPVCHETSCDTWRMFWIEVPRDVVRVVGPDAASYLQSQLSNDLRSMEVGDSLWSFLLQPTGKVDVLLRVWRHGEDEFVVDTDGGAGEAMVARLQRFKIRVKADIEPLAWRCIALRGDDVVAPEGSVVGWGGGVDLLGPDVEPPVGAAPGSADELLAERIAAVWPAMEADGVGEITPGHTIPAETGITDVAVSFTKGCYPGQELVERMDSRGSSAPRLLQAVSVPAGTAPGDVYVVDGAEAGVVTSVLGTAALALVKRAALAH